MFCVRVPSITVVSQKLKERWQSQNDTRVMGQSVYNWQQSGEGCTSKTIIFTGMLGKLKSTFFEQNVQIDKNCRYFTVFISARADSSPCLYQSVQIVHGVYISPCRQSTVFKLFFVDVPMWFKQVLQIFHGGA